MFSTAKKTRANQSRNGKGGAKSSSHPRVVRLPEPDAVETPNTSDTFQSTDQSVDRLKVTSISRDILCELHAGKHPIFTGVWDWDILVDNRHLDSSSEIDQACWENNCWEENIDVSYAEMQLNLPNSLQIQRQFLLARRDRFAFSRTWWKCLAMFSAVFAVI